MPATSKAQRRFMGIAESIKKGKTPASYSPNAAKAARTMSAKSIRHFARTKEKGLPEKVKRTRVANKENPFSFRDLIKKIKGRKRQRDLIMKELFPDEAQVDTG